MVETERNDADLCADVKENLDRAWERHLTDEADLENLIRARDALNQQIEEKRKQCQESEQEWLNKAQGNWGKTQGGNE